MKANFIDRSQSLSTRTFMSFWRLPVENNSINQEPPDGFYWNWTSRRILRLCSVHTNHSFIEQIMAKLSNCFISETAPVPEISIFDYLSHIFRSALHGSLHLCSGQLWRFIDDEWQLYKNWHCPGGRERWKFVNLKVPFYKNGINYHASAGLLTIQEKTCACHKCAYIRHQMSLEGYRRLLWKFSVVLFIACAPWQLLNDVKPSWKTR